ncbi:MAG: flagellar hook-length control protein FliK, partial [Defluviitaleaceae bacterium]|nr:flagellar hook-length control protein FliK [Defluviitaleaceae bacterium]
TLAALENPSSLVPPGEAREGFVAQLKQFLNVQPQASQQQAAGQPIQNAQPEVFLEALKMAAQEIAQMAKAQSGGDATPLSQSAENIADIIDFAKNITDTKLYMQFPFSVEDRKHLAELHVFKRKGDKNKKINGDKATALLALDMAFLGRVEVLVNKAGKTVNVQFRSDKGSTLDTVALNRKDLSDLLNNAGFTLTNVQTKKINEKFDITQTQQEARGLPREMAIQPRQDDGPARYSFDVRV